MSYDQVAEVFQIDRESARRRVIRGKWRREKGNDGRVLVYVPVEVLPDNPGTPPVTPPGLSPVTVPLLAAIERLSGQLDADRDKTRDALAAAEAERDALRVQLAEIQARRVGDVEALRRAERDLADLRRLPFWRRVLGS